MDTPQARRARVITAGNALGLQYFDGYGGAPVARPMLGGTASGFHSMPQGGGADQVLVLHEKDQRAAAAISQTDTPAKLPALLAGESLILHPSGAYVKFSNTGAVLTVYVNANLQMVFDQTTNRLNITATGGVYIGGVALTVP